MQTDLQVLWNSVKENLPHQNLLRTKQVQEILNVHFPCILCVVCVVVFVGQDHWQLYYEVLLMVLTTCFLWGRGTLYLFEGFQHQYYSQWCISDRNAPGELDLNCNSWYNGGCFSSKTKNTRPSLLITEQDLSMPDHYLPANFSIHLKCTVPQMKTKKKHEEWLCTETHCQTDQWWIHHIHTPYSHYRRITHRMISIH